MHTPARQVSLLVAVLPSLQGEPSGARPRVWALAEAERQSADGPHDVAFRQPGDDDAGAAASEPAAARDQATGTCLCAPLARLWSALCGRSGGARK